MHHQDLVGIRPVRQHNVIDVMSDLKLKCSIEQTGNTEGITSLLAKYRPCIVVDESGGQYCPFQ